MRQAGFSASTRIPAGARHPSAGMGARFPRSRAGATPRMQQRRHGCCIVALRAADRRAARPCRARLRPAQQSRIGYQKSMFPALRETLNTLLITQHPASNARAA
ncbi:hypothetical protein QZM35_34680 [Burkholderia sp. AU45274]|uniref:hypothetical protein n=1 Tax=Burkholderia sp. AU45274 TaxID=3059205 RepID=UPI0026512E3E|nr:hypothetical protein [Burkholderia sp. AU45274]MDN7492874.1 hypothetical protein [Burkholderia sp. AU45274]